MSVFSRHGTTIPADTLNLYKNLVALAGLVVVLVVTQPAVPASPALFGWLAVSGLIGLTLGDTALFAALRRLGAQVTSSSQCLAPPIAALLALFALNETLNGMEWLGLLTTTSAVAAGILLGRRPGAHLASLPRPVLWAGVGFAVLAAACQGLGLVIARDALQGIDVMLGTAARIVPACIMLYAGMCLRGQPGSLSQVFVNKRQFWLLTVAAFGGTFLGLVLMSFGVKYAKAGVTAALTSTYPIWIIPIAKFILKERVTWAAAACTVVAVIGIVIMVGGGA
jgi:drug/metabolite transporter (DMT)-like permease